MSWNWRWTIEDGDGYGLGWPVQGVEVCTARDGLRRVGWGRGGVRQVFGADEGWCPLVSNSLQELTNGSITCFVSTVSGWVGGEG